MTVPFLFYAVPDTNPAGPVTVFTDRFWDDKEHWIPESVGVVPLSMKPYWGPIPGPEVGPLEGDPNAWIAGFSYEDWIAGKLGGTCWPLQLPTIKVKVAQVQSIVPPSITQRSFNQAQTVNAWPIVPVSLNQVQTIFERTTRALLEQVQTILGVIEADVSQAQDFETGTLTDCCPDPIPHNLLLTVGPDSPPSCVDGETVIATDRGVPPHLGSWSYQFNLPDSTWLNISIRCVDAVTGWLAILTTSLSETYEPTITTWTCSPFSLSVLLPGGLFTDPCWANDTTFNFHQ